MIAFVCRCGARPAEEVGWRMGYYKIDNVTVEAEPGLMGLGTRRCNHCEQIGKIVCDGRGPYCRVTATRCHWHQCVTVKFETR